MLIFGAICVAVGCLIVGAFWGLLLWPLVAQIRAWAAEEDRRYGARIRAAACVVEGIRDARLRRALTRQTEEV